MTDTKKRKRLPPEVRRELILDHAAELIRESGISSLNMDRLGRRAGISKPLVYNYFPNRTDLLKALLLREVARNRENNLRVAEATTTVEELIRATSRAMLEYAAERGIVLQQLMLEPGIADVLRELDNESHQRHVRYLSRRLKADFNIPKHISDVAIDLGLGLSSSAGAYLERTKCDTRFLEDILVTMIMGSLMAVSDACKSGELAPDEALSTAAE